MKKILFLYCFLLIFPCKTFADIIKIETNTWGNNRPLIWTCTLEKLESENQLAYFSFINGNKVEYFQVHITRIYSLTMDSQNRVNRSFPPSRQDLATPLPTNPRSRRIIELSNQNFVADDIPSNVRIRPDRKAMILSLNGDVINANLQEVQLKVRAGNRKISEFKINRSDLLKWVR